MGVMSALSVEDLRPIAMGLDHPEAVAEGPDQMLYAGGEHGQVYRIDPADGSVEQIANTGGYHLGIALDAAGTIYVCDRGIIGAGVIWRIAGGAPERWCETAGGEPLKFPNWGAFAPDGSMLVSDSGIPHPQTPDGRLVRVPPGGGDAEVLDLPPLALPNGLAYGPDGQAYVLESFQPRLSRLSDKGLEVVAELPGVVPDGVAVTQDGGFVIACYYPFQLLYIPPGANKAQLLLDDAIGIHAPMPTNVAFFGDNRTTLAVASLGGTIINALDTPLRGAPLHYPAPPKNPSSQS